MITGDLRLAIGRAVTAAGWHAPDPGLRPTGTPGRYASSVAFALGGAPKATAARLAERVGGEPQVASVEVTGSGFLAITVTPEALAAIPERIVSVGPDCVTSDALRGMTVTAPADTDPLAAASWEEARKALAAQLTVRLAAAAGATVARGAAERMPLTQHPSASRGAQDAVAAVSFAGADAVRFWLARAMPGQLIRVDPLIMARHVPDNPAYAVRYAHARAASGVRWAASRGTDTVSTEAVLRCPPADQAEWVLLDALSWLPERVAIAARRGRPDEFARYLEELARAVLAALPGNDRLTLAAAARTGLAAGLGLLGVTAPDRL